MQDDKGPFYYPFPENKKVRMYVKDEAGEVWFRLWNRDDDKLWDDHGWVPWGAIQKAQEMYANAKKSGFDPKAAYDLEVAKLMLKESKK